MTFLTVSTNSSHRTIKRALRCLNKHLDSKYCWGTAIEATLTTKQVNLVQKGSDWMTPLGGARSKCNIIYLCVSCSPHQGAVASNGWFLTTSNIVVDPATGRLNKLINPKWKCPFCGAKYINCSGSRGIMVDDRESDEDAGEIVIFFRCPWTCTEWISPIPITCWNGAWRH